MLSICVGRGLLCILICILPGLHTVTFGHTFYCVTVWTTDDQCGIFWVTSYTVVPQSSHAQDECNDECYKQQSNCRMILTCSTAKKFNSHLSKSLLRCCLFLLRLHICNICWLCKYLWDAQGQQTDCNGGTSSRQGAPLVECEWTIWKGNYSYCVSMTAVVCEEVIDSRLQEPSNQKILVNKKELCTVKELITC